MKDRYDNVDEYIEDLKQEIPKKDKCATHWYNLGLAFLSKRDFTAAEEAFLNALRQSPHLAEAYVQLGGICMERGDMEGCLRYNQEAANCRPKFAIPQSNIAFVHLQNGEPDKAIAALEKALKWDPSFVQARNALATAQFMKGNLEASEKTCRDLLADQPEFAPAWQNLALALFEQGRHDEAINACDRARELGHEIPEGFLEELKPYRK